MSGGARGKFLAFLNEIYEVQRIQRRGNVSFSNHFVQDLKLTWPTPSTVCQCFKQTLLRETGDTKQISICLDNNIIIINVQPDKINLGRQDPAILSNDLLLFAALYNTPCTYHGQASVENICTAKEHNGQNSRHKVKCKTDIPLQKDPNRL